MEIFAVAADTFTIPSTQSLGFSILLNRHNSTSTGTLSVSSSISPIDSMAPPITRPNLYKIPRTFRRMKRRTRKRSQTGDSDEGDDNGLFDGDDGPFGGSGGVGGGGSGGRGWNSDGYGGADWEESASSSFSDPAFDFVYKVLCWIVLWNCMHFALKKILRIVANGFGDPSREKVPMRLGLLG